MKRALLSTLLVAVWISLGSVLVTASQIGQQALQERVAALTQSMAANQARLKKYQWLQTTQVSVKGKPMQEQQDMCRYGPDGQVEKTPVGPAPEPKQPPGGIKGRIVKKKAAETKDYMTRLKSLISHYAPPNREMIHASMQAGKASLNASAGQRVLTFRDYYKQGDAVSFSLNPATKSLDTYDVTTYLDDPKSDVVTLTNKFASLPGGTNYLEQTLLHANSKQIQITTTNSNYTSAGQ